VNHCCRMVDALLDRRGLAPNEEDYLEEFFLRLPRMDASTVAGTGA
jgi:hypothetical protein